MKEKLGICILATIPLRANPADQAEMVSQLLFGETYTVLKTAKDWLLVKTAFDEYEGWMHQKQFTSIDEKLFIKLNPTLFLITNQLSTPITNQSTHNIYFIPFGSTIPVIKNQKFKLLDQTYSINKNALSKAEFVSRDNIIKTAKKFLNAPYLWGGRTIFGIDCSGFSQIVYKSAGITLKRDAHQQAEQGKKVNRLINALPGDLAFFENTERKIVHVGILVTKNKIIHASGSVRIDSITEDGIYNQGLKKQTHTLKCIKSLVY